MMQRQRRVLAFFWLVLASIASAPVIAQTQQSSDAADIAKIAEWARKDGKQSYIAGDVAKALGLSSSGENIPTTVLAFENAKATTISFVIPSQGDAYVMTAKHSWDTIFWLVRDGEVRKTILNNGAGARTTSNDTYLGLWKQVKDAFLHVMTSHLPGAPGG